MWMRFEICSLWLEDMMSIWIQRTAAGGFHTSPMIALCHEFQPLTVSVEEVPSRRRRYMSATGTSMP